jgi:hypothetical protein
LKEKIRKLLTFRNPLFDAAGAHAPARFFEFHDDAAPGVMEKFQRILDGRTPEQQSQALRVVKAFRRIEEKMEAADIQFPASSSRLRNPQTPAILNRAHSPLAGITAGLQ